jgi:hypothetical protein
MSPNQSKPRARSSSFWLNHATPAVLALIVFVFSLDFSLQLAAENPKDNLTHSSKNLTKTPQTKKPEELEQQSFEFAAMGIENISQSLKVTDQDFRLSNLAQMWNSSSNFSNNPEFNKLINYFDPSSADAFMKNNLILNWKNFSLTPAFLGQLKLLKITIFNRGLDYQ